MIGYVTVGTNDLERAVAFYDKLFAMIGAGRFMEEDSFVAWATSADTPGFAATKPNDGNPATVGNGMMVKLSSWAVPTKAPRDQEVISSMPATSATSTATS